MYLLARLLLSRRCYYWVNESINQIRCRNLLTIVLLRDSMRVLLRWFIGLSLIGIILRWGFLIWELILSWVSTVPGEHCLKIAVSNPTQAGQRFTWSKTWCDRQQLWKAIITRDAVTRLSIPIRGRGKITWRKPELKFGRT